MQETPLPNDPERTARIDYLNVRQGEEPPRSVPLPENAPTTASVTAHPARPLRPSSRLPVLASILAVLVVMLAIPPFVRRVSRSWHSGRNEAALEALDDARLREFSDAYTLASRLVVEGVGNSVVFIETQRVAEAEIPSDERQYYFGPPRQATGQGSGVIVDEEGYIITNFHVVTGSNRILVHLNEDRQPAIAEVVGIDLLTDLAVLKIAADQLTAAKWGDSDTLSVGDDVWAIGSPFGLDNTVTRGIVSAKDRRGIGRTRYQNFLQTDAAVNPGNSGGALVNIHGELVGINTAIVGPSYQGISFAIPSNMAREVYDRLRKDGEFDRGWLGVEMAEMTPELAKALGLDSPHGALVARVLKRSPALAAAMQRGDIIVAWNAERVEDRRALSLMVAETDPGSTVDVLVLREGKRVKLSVKVGKLPLQLFR